MNKTNCPNCSSGVAGKFCSNCGQKEVHRITMPLLWHDLAHAFTHADKGFLYLMIQLFKKPGIVAREYIVEGKRKKYFLPLQYLVIIGAVATIIVSNSHYIEAAIKEMSRFTGASQGSARQEAFMQKMALLQSKYYNFLLLLQLPFYALAASIVYRKHKFSFAELLTLQTFVTAQTTVISMLLILIVTLLKAPVTYISTIMLAISIMYSTWTYVQFFRDKLFTGILKAVSSHVLGMLFFIVLSVLVGFVIGAFIFR